MPPAVARIRNCMRSKALPSATLIGAGPAARCPCSVAVSSPRTTDAPGTACIGSNARLSNIDEITLGDIREIDQQIHALSGREQYLLATNAAFEQSAIGADQDERKRSGIDAAEREPIRSRVRCVQQSQPVPACRDIVIRAQAAVDVGQAPVPAQQFVFRGGRVAIAVANAAILQHQRELGAAGREIERLPHDALVVVVDFDEPEEAAIDLAAPSRHAGAGGTNTDRRGCASRTRSRNVSPGAISASPLPSLRVSIVSPCQCTIVGSGSALASATRTEAPAAVTSVGLSNVRLPAATSNASRSLRRSCAHRERRRSNVQTGEPAVCPRHV